MNKTQGWFLISLVAVTCLVCALDLACSNLAKDTDNNEMTTVIELLTRGLIVSPIIEVDIDGNGFRDYLYLNERTLEARLHFNYNYDYDWGLNYLPSLLVEIHGCISNKLPDSA